MAKKKEVKVKLERTYNIPLRRKFRNTAKHKKTPKAVRTIKEFLKKHMKTDKIRLGMNLNEFLWKHGIKNPPHHVRVHVIKEGDVVNAELEGFKFKEAVKVQEKKTAPALSEKPTAQKSKGFLSSEAPTKDVPKDKPKEEKKPAPKPAPKPK